MSDRRRFMLKLACLSALATRWNYAIAAPSRPTEPVSADGNSKSVLVIGDSLSAEYGLSQGTGWVAHVGERLRRQGEGYQIHNSSVSGDTSSGGLNRLGAALERYQPDVVIIELGSNDALRGLPLDMTQQNLAQMIEQAKSAGAQVLLIGMQIPPNYGRRYASQFSELFVTLSDRYQTALVPFLFEGFATDHGRFQQDGIHPNERAQPDMAETVWRQLQPLLEP